MKTTTPRTPAAAQLRAGLACIFQWLHGRRPLQPGPLLAGLALALLAFAARAQPRDGIDLFREDGAAQAAAQASPVAAQLRRARALSLDVAALDAALAPARRGAELVLVLPLPDGRSARFGVREKALMDAATAARFRSCAPTPGAASTTPRQRPG